VLALSGGAVVGYKVIAPPAPQTVVISNEARVSDAPSPDWEKRLNAVYALADGQVVKVVGPPMMPERELYWQHIQTPGAKLFGGATFVFEWTGSKLNWQMLSGGPGFLEMPLQGAAHLHSWEIDASIPMGMRFDGDWVVRKGASQQQIMDGLAELVSTNLRRQVRFERRHVVRDALIVRGTYHFVPLTGQKYDGILELGDPFPGNQEMKPFPDHTTLKRYLEGLDIFAHKKVIVETPSADTKDTIYRQATSGNGDTYMRNVAAQTSLQFDTEPREMDVWFMVDMGATTRASSRPVG